MLATLVIVFREIIEAGLIVGIVLAATKGVAGRGLWVAYGGAAGVAGAVVGVAVSLAVPLHHKLVAVALAVPAAAFAIIAFFVVAYFLDDGDLKTVLAWVRRVARWRS